MAATNYEIRIVGDKLGLSGKNIVFESEPFFDLQVGERVLQIGNGKENGTIRTDRFVNYVEYVGSIVCQFKEKEKMYAFKLPKEINGESYYILYGATTEEIFTEAVYSKKDRKTGNVSSYLRFYASEFIRCN